MEMTSMQPNIIRRTLNMKVHAVYLSFEVSVSSD